jgi:uncharacterized membrane protein
MSKWIADREPALSPRFACGQAASLSLAGHARAFHNEAANRRLIGVGGLDAALADKFNLIESYVALAIERGAVFVVAFGALQAMVALLKAIANGQATGLEGRQIWLRFATWILLGLEFALAADILRAAVAPTWDDISKLAVIATIRTMLNYFLAKDIMAFDKSQEAGSEVGAAYAKPARIRKLRHC